METATFPAKKKRTHIDALMQKKIKKNKSSEMPRLKIKNKKNMYGPKVF